MKTAHTKRPEFSALIIRVFLLGAGFMLLFYAMFFRLSMMKTENMVIERRLSIVASHHFNSYRQGVRGDITIDPLLTLYDKFESLPTMIQGKVTPNWTGSMHMTFDDDSELQLFASEIATPDGNRIVYALENSDAVEWSDANFVLFELLLLASGILLFLLVCFYIVKTVRQITTPINELAMTLSTSDANAFKPYQVEPDSTFEFARIVRAINAYNMKQAQQLERERSFTRYISHELRTPMTIIRGALSNMRTQGVDSKYLSRIDDASEQMASLTNTFLLLAREGAFEKERVHVDSTFLDKINQDIEDKIAANHVECYWQLRAPFTLAAHPLLLKAAIQNLLLNALGCSFEGKVVALVDSTRIDIVDNGTGLGDKPRGYEGFGIGLVLVRDICDKYDWQFELADNETGGCTASIVFHTE